MNKFAKLWRGLHIFFSIATFDLNTNACFSQNFNPVGLIFYTRIYVIFCLKPTKYVMKLTIGYCQHKSSYMKGKMAALCELVKSV